MRESNSVHINCGRWNHRRIPVDLDIEYWPLDASKSRPGRMIEIGGDGFLLCLKESVEVAQDLRISLLVDSGFDFLLIEPHVRVVWNESPLNGGGHCFQNGTKIIDISAEEYQNLEYFLCSLRKSGRSISATKYPKSGLSKIAEEIHFPP